MDIELTAGLQGPKLQKWKDFLSRAGLEADLQIERTCLIWEEDQLIATGSRQDNLLKCIAVDEAHQGEGLTATLLTQLRQDAFASGHSHLFLYTKPKNKYMFSSLFFYPVAQTEQVLLMENRKDGISDFLSKLPVPCREGRIGAAVMNCNPFTLGHRYLIETAAKECDHLYIFVLSEDKSEFSAHDRMEMVKLGTQDLPNVTVLPTGPYLISSATFPTYFLKERDNAENIHCLLDIEIFCKYFVPKFGITDRFVGTEPLSPMTNMYNEALTAHLPQKGIRLSQIPRLEKTGIPISASAVRSYLETGDKNALRALVPDTTYEYLKTKGFIKQGGTTMAKSRPTHLLSSYYAPRGAHRMQDLGQQLAQMYLNPNDKLIGIIGEAGSGKSALIRGMFPGLELTNDDNGVYIRPLPILEQDRSFAFFSPHTYHLDIRFENGFTQMTELADAISEALNKGRRVVVEHFDLVYPLLGANANLLIGVGEQVLVARPGVFGPEPEEIKTAVYSSLPYRLMAHTAEDICGMFIDDADNERCGHKDLRHGFAITFPETPPNIDIAELERKVNEVIAQDLPVTYVDEHHISIGDSVQLCDGPRVHVHRTGQIENFHLMNHFIYDRFKKRYLLVGCVSEDAEEILKKLENRHQSPGWD